MCFNVSGAYQSRPLQGLFIHSPLSVPFINIIPLQVEEAMHREEEHKRVGEERRGEERRKNTNVNNNSSTSTDSPRMNLLMD